jgi:hypothetical protein
MATQTLKSQVPRRPRIGGLCVRAIFRQRTVGDFCPRNCGRHIVLHASGRAANIFDPNGFGVCGIYRSRAAESAAPRVESRDPQVLPSTITLNSHAHIAGSMDGMSSSAVIRLLSRCCHSLR